MIAMPSPRYLREMANKALIHSVRLGSGTRSFYLRGSNSKDRYIVVWILDGDL